jgi:very-short-patch-repair endonuclease
MTDRSDGPPNARESNPPPPRGGSTAQPPGWGAAEGRRETAGLQQRARRLRREPTSAEQRFWRFVRRRLALAGSHVRRRAVVDCYVVDFCCFRARLVIEIDGATHSTPREQAHDRRRQAALEQAGYHVLRFTNAEVFDSIDAVMDTVHAAIMRRAPELFEDRPSRARGSYPPPCREGRRHSRRGGDGAAGAPGPASPPPRPTPQGGGETTPPRRRT